MQIEFIKYQGTGNDFVIIDQRKLASELTNDLIQKICNRRFGVGADGLILIKPHDEFDFEMRYFNSDGSRSFCGNGARCAVHFARQLGYFTEKCTFLAIDGEHSAEIVENEQVKLKMNDVDSIEGNESGHFILHTGSPHYIKFTENLEDEDIVTYGRLIRFNELYKKEGINVNIAEIGSDIITMLTYERGVEDETYSCGTGATAVALAFREKNKLEGKVSTKIKVKGGNLEVQSNKINDKFEDIYLIGPAKPVFNGSINV